MALSPKLEMRQGQTLVMTPQLQQAIKLLQLSNLDLQSYISEQLETNPLLEVDDRDRETGSASDAGSTSDTDARGTDRDSGDKAAASGDGADGAGEGSSEGPGDTQAMDKALEGGDDLQRVADLDTDYDNVYSDDGPSDRAMGAADVGGGQLDWSSVGKSGGRFDDDENTLEGSVTPELSLRDHLGEQLQIAIKDPVDRLIGADLIDSVNEAGYLTTTPEMVAERIGASLEDVEAVLRVLQTFEPTGVCARDLKDCLRLQLREADRLDPIMDVFIEHLELLAKQDFAQLQKICGVDDDDLAEMLSDVKKLNPKPGMAFGGDVIQPVVPDVFVYQKSDGGWHVELNSETLPRVLVNSRYFAEVSSATGGKDDKAYLTDCLNQANWLVKSLDQRAKTILKVSSEIIRQQDAFLVYGVRHLRPLNLRTVAEAIGMHESTVSRVTSNKYMATSRGVFELKYFFTSAIASTGGGQAHSAEAVRARIKEMIDAEAPNRVLSDDRIVELLKGDGVDIARRTVAKYREAMRIPSSVQRRRLKKISA